MDKLERNSLEIYLYSWNFVNSDGILTCEEDIVFDSSPEIWPIFRVELNSVLTKCGLLSVLSTTSGAGGGETPTKISFQEVCLGNVLQLKVNKMALWCSMGKVVMDGISLWGWLKVMYETAEKLEPLYNLFR